MVLQVHDELLFEVEERSLDRARELVRTEMENAWKLSVPLVVEVGSGRNWAEAH
jgi:DNA polymerase-1